MEMHSSLDFNTEKTGKFTFIRLFVWVLVGFAIKCMGRDKGGGALKYESDGYVHIGE